MTILRGFTEPARRPTTITNSKRFFLTSFPQRLLVVRCQALWYTPGGTTSSEIPI
jgi:hypothetical protein